MSRPSTSPAVSRPLADQLSRTSVSIQGRNSVVASGDASEVKRMLDLSLYLERPTAPRSNVKPSAAKRRQSTLTQARLGSLSSYRSLPDRDDSFSLSSSQQMSDLPVALSSPHRFDDLHESKSESESESESASNQIQLHSPPQQHQQQQQHQHNQHQHHHQPQPQQQQTNQSSVALDEDYEIFRRLSPYKRSSIVRYAKQQQELKHQQSTNRPLLRLPFPSRSHQAYSYSTLPTFSRQVVLTTTNNQHPNDSNQQPDQIVVTLQLQRLKIKSKVNTTFGARSIRAQRIASKQRKQLTHQPTPLLWIQPKDLGEPNSPLSPRSPLATSAAPEPANAHAISDSTSPKEIVDRIRRMSRFHIWRSWPYHLKIDAKQAQLRIIAKYNPKQQQQELDSEPTSRLGHSSLIELSRVALSRLLTSRIAPGNAAAYLYHLHRIKTQVIDCDSLCKLIESCEDETLAFHDWISDSHHSGSFHAQLLFNAHSIHTLSHADVVWLMTHMSVVSCSEMISIYKHAAAAAAVGDISRCSIEKIGAHSRVSTTSNSLSSSAASTATNSSSTSSTAASHRCSALAATLQHQWLVEQEHRAAIDKLSRSNGWMNQFFDPRPANDHLNEDEIDSLLSCDSGLHTLYFLQVLTAERLVFRSHNALCLMLSAMRAWQNTKRRGQCAIVQRVLQQDALSWNRFLPRDAVAHIDMYSASQLLHATPHHDSHSLFMTLQQLLFKREFRVDTTVPNAQLNPLFSNVEDLHASVESVQNQLIQIHLPSVVRFIQQHRAVSPLDKINLQNRNQTDNAASSPADSSRNSKAFFSAQFPPLDDAASINSLLIAFEAAGLWPDHLLPVLKQLQQRYISQGLTRIQSVPELVQLMVREQQQMIDCRFGWYQELVAPHRDASHETSPPLLSHSAAQNLTCDDLTPFFDPDVYGSIESVSALMERMRRTIAHSDASISRKVTTFSSFDSLARALARERRNDVELVLQRLNDDILPLVYSDESRLLSSAARSVDCLPAPLKLRRLVDLLLSALDEEHLPPSYNSEHMIIKRANLDQVRSKFPSTHLQSHHDSDQKTIQDQIAYAESIQTHLSLFHPICVFIQSISERLASINRDMRQNLLPSFQTFDALVDYILACDPIQHHMNAMREMQRQMIQQYQANDFGMRHQTMPFDVQSSDALEQNDSASQERTSAQLIYCDAILRREFSNHKQNHQKQQQHQQQQHHQHQHQHQRQSDSHPYHLSDSDFDPPINVFQSPVAQFDPIAFALFTNPVLEANQNEQTEHESRLHSPSIHPLILEASPRQELSDAAPQSNPAQRELDAQSTHIQTNASQTDKETEHKQNNSDAKIESNTQAPAPIEKGANHSPAPASAPVTVPASVPVPAPVPASIPASVSAPMQVPMPVPMPTPTPAPAPAPAPVAPVQARSPSPLAAVPLQTPTAKPQILPDLALPKDDARVPAVDSSLSSSSTRVSTPSLPPVPISHSLICETIHKHTLIPLDPSSVSRPRTSPHKSSLDSPANQAKSRPSAQPIRSGESLHRKSRSALIGLTLQQSDSLLDKCGGAGHLLRCLQLLEQIGVKRIDQASSQIVDPPSGLAPAKVKSSRGNADANSSKRNSNSSTPKPKRHSVQPLYENFDQLASALEFEQSKCASFDLAVTGASISKTQIHSVFAWLTSTECQLLNGDTLSSDLDRQSLLDLIRAGRTPELTLAAVQALQAMGMECDSFNDLLLVLRSLPQSSFSPTSLLGDIDKIQQIIPGVRFRPRPAPDQLNGDSQLPPNSSADLVSSPLSRPSGPIRATSSFQFSQQDIQGSQSARAPESSHKTDTNSYAQASETPDRHSSGAPTNESHSANGNSVASGPHRDEAHRLSRTAGTMSRRSRSKSTSTVKNGETISHSPALSSIAARRASTATAIAKQNSATLSTSQSVHSHTKAPTDSRQGSPLASRLTVGQSRLRFSASTEARESTKQIASQANNASPTKSKRAKSNMPHSADNGVDSKKSLARQSSPSPSASSTRLERTTEQSPNQNSTQTQNIVINPIPQQHQSQSHQVEIVTPIAPIEKGAGTSTCPLHSNRRGSVSALAAAAKARNKRKEKDQKVNTDHQTSSPNILAPHTSQLHKSENKSTTSVKQQIAPSHAAPIDDAPSIQASGDSISGAQLPAYSAEHRAALRSRASISASDVSALIGASKTAHLDSSKQPTGASTLDEWSAFLCEADSEQLSPHAMTILVGYLEAPDCLFWSSTSKPAFTPGDVSLLVRACGGSIDHCYLHLNSAATRQAKFESLSQACEDVFQEHKTCPARIDELLAYILSSDCTLLAPLLKQLTVSRELCEYLFLCSTGNRSAMQLLEQLQKAENSTIQFGSMQELINECRDLMQPQQTRTEEQTQEDQAETTPAPNHQDRPSQTLDDSTTTRETARAIGANSSPDQRRSDLDQNSQRTQDAAVIDAPRVATPKATKSRQVGSEDQSASDIRRAATSPAKPESSCDDTPHIDDPIT